MADANSTQLKVCEHCGERYENPQSQAKYCSVSCRKKHERQKYRKVKRYGPHTCRLCSVTFYQRHPKRDTFCGRECNFIHRKIMKVAIAQHRSMAAKAARYVASLHPNPKDQVRAEIRALRRIARYIADRITECNCCGASFIRRRQYQRSCSHECMNSQRAATRRKASKSPSARAARSRRKALARGCNGADRIDPIKVFERDKWRCHICGTRTPKSLRGTIQDRAPELEHIVSLADGGSHTWGNVACSCRKCNIHKGSSSAGQLGLGFAA